MKKKITINNKYVIINEKGDTSDIITSVMGMYDFTYDPQIEELARELVGDNEFDTCRNIWRYLIDNVRYRADIGVQEIRTPARLLHDGTGDCKSYSILTACVLRYLAIPHVFRFVSYSNRKEATHVYVVAIIDNKELPIDAVAYVQQGADFGGELKYRYKVDMADRTTKIAYVSGLGRTGSQRRIRRVGDASGAWEASTVDEAMEYLKGDRFKVWLDGESDSTITLAKGYLLSEWDLYWTNYFYARSDDKRVEALNRLQYIAVMIELYNEYYLDNEMLYKAGLAVSHMIANESLHSGEPDPAQRVFFSPDITNLAKKYTGDYDQPPYIDSFMSVWQREVIDQNVPAMDDDGQPMSIGSTSDLHSQFKSTGCYYIYTYIPDSDEKKYGQTVYKKRRIQYAQRELNYDNLSKKMTRATQDNLIWNGATETFESTPDVFLSDYFAGKVSVKGIGITPEVIIALVMAVCSVIVAIFQYFANKNLTKSDLEAGAFGFDDYFNPASAGGTNTGSNGITDALGGGIAWIIPIALAGGVLFSVMNKKNKKSGESKSKSE